MSTNSDNKLFEFAREVNHYCELRPDSELAKIKVVPSYILVGDQSSGKTSLLSRLARMPLGYTANKTGTRRPVEYNLIHDPSKREPDIEVNSKKVAVEDFLKVMIEENGTEGFRDSAVSVKILWRDIPESVIVADMPGMKDGDTAPENMILKRLRNANVIPVVILEPKDFDSKHFAFDLLKRAGRSYSDIIAVVNKCDEKMAEKGQWSNQSDWTDFWETANKKGFKKICITGWPCINSDRNNPDLEKQKRALGESCEQENNLIQEWKRRVNVCAEALECVGLEKFRQMLHRDQSARLGELCSRSLPLIRRENAEIAVKLQELRSKSKDSLKRSLSNIMHEWAHEVAQLLDGKVDVHDFLESSSTASDDVQWLSSHGAHRYDLLPSYSLHRPCTQSLLEGVSTSSFFTISEDSDGDGLPDHASWITAVSSCIFGAEAKLVGKAAFERILDVVFTASLCRIFQHVLMEFDAKFINNILAENSQDSGNKVIQQFVKRVLTRSLHPMIDVMSLLIWKHVEICFTLANKPWSKDADNLKDVGLRHHFDSSAELYAHALVKILNQELHERLEEHGELLQARCRGGKSNCSIANNFSGNTFPDAEDHSKYIDLSEADFCDAASGFLQIGIDVLEKASDKCRRNVRFYEILQLAAVQMKSKQGKTHDLNPKEIFRSQSQIDAISAVEVQKMRSTVLQMTSGKTINIELEVQDASGSWPKERDFEETPNELVDTLIHKRSDEKILNGLLKPEALCCLVALNDPKEGKWLTCSKVPKSGNRQWSMTGGRNQTQCPEGSYRVELTAQAKDQMDPDLDKLVTIDILCRKVKVTIKSVSLRTDRVPETSADSGSSESQSDREDSGEVKTGATEVMKTAMILVKHMNSMDFRKLMVDLSCELVEQTVSFRELLEKRLEKLKLTAKKKIGP
ncbi:unnamed protein product [Cladocopium goreaui]|uniref:Dynamin N-terminal domain-containing protein n=1 Tax=Cladocopium goreaui TaxID=2562237 RepID=A0A9P1CG74_9DINO|nr:unnamed protein product [Cladocopium goreaui]